MYFNIFTTRFMYKEWVLEGANLLGGLDYFGLLNY